MRAFVFYSIWAFYPPKTQQPIDIKFFVWYNSNKFYVVCISIIKEVDQMKKLLLVVLSLMLTLTLAGTAMGEGLAVGT